MMVQLLIMSLVILSNSRNYEMVGMLTLGINSGAYVSEIVRSGLMSIDPGQMEAGRSLGMGYATTMGVDTDPFEDIVPELCEGAAALLDRTFERSPGDFEMIYHVGDGYAIPNPKDTPYIREMARTEGILLDPVYTGKAWAGMLRQLEAGHFGGEDVIVFVHTGGAAALFAMDVIRFPDRHLSIMLTENIIIFRQASIVAHCKILILKQPAKQGGRFIDAVLHRHMIVIRYLHSKQAIFIQQADDTGQEIFLIGKPLQKGIGKNKIKFSQIRKGLTAIPLYPPDLVRALPCFLQHLV